MSLENKKERNYENYTEDMDLTIFEVDKTEKID